MRRGTGIATAALLLAAGSVPGLSGRAKSGGVC